MYLVDKEIKRYIKEISLIENVEDANIGAISCDVCIEYIIDNNEKNSQLNSFELEPGATVIVATKEKLNMPEDMVAQVIPKNSRIRMGIKIDAPVYQPGHKTRIFIAVTNLSSAIVELKEGEQIAAVAFSKLSEKPEQKYDGSFQDEDKYKGLAAYDSVWERRIKAVNDKYKNLKGLEKSIYSTVIVLMTIFIGIFSLINLEVNYIGESTTLINMLIYTIIFISGVSALVAIINCILPDSENKKYKWVLFIIPVICFIVAAVLLKTMCQM